MNKLHNIRYGFLKLVWTYEQWFVLMFPHIPHNGVSYEDVAMEDLRWWFYEYLMNWEGDYE